LRQEVRTAERGIVIFDVGGVLLVDLISSLIDSISTAFSLDVALISAAYRSDGLRDALWQGHISTGTFWSVLGSRLGVELDPEIWDNKCIDLQGPLFPASSLQALAKRNDLGILTNHRPEWLYTILERETLNAILHPVVISAEVALMKPDPKIYEELISRLTQPYRRRLYVDNNVSNLAPARVRGFDVLQAGPDCNWMEKLQLWPRD
jgi:FMN phosphatase YigB (HAD superfamily)